MNKSNNDIKTFFFSLDMRQRNNICYLLSVLVECMLIIEDDATKMKKKFLCDLGSKIFLRYISPLKLCLFCV